MNKYSFLLLIFCLFTALPALTQAQENNEVVVEKSNDKIFLNGKTYYLHTVKKKENLYRISRAYGVTYKDIIMANPETISGVVKEGQVLKIPAEPSSPRNIKHIESENFIYHVTEEKQTIFYLTQKYNIPQEELIKYNPELATSSLKVGQVIRIPKKNDVSTGTDTFHPIDKYIEYKVKRRDTKYSISKKHDITIDELIAANPQLNTGDLKSGERINIPVKSETTIVAAPPAAYADSVAVSGDSLQTDTSECSAYKPYSESFDVALLLPFSISENEARASLDSAAMANNPDKKITTELLSRTTFSLEFYEGFLLAADSLKKLGLSLRIHTFDTGKDLASCNRVLSKPELANMDFMIGPFFSEGFEKSGEFTLNQKINQVSVVSGNSNVLKSNPYFFQLIPSDSIYLDSMMQYIARYPKKNIVLVNSNILQDKDMTDLYSRRLRSIFGNALKIFNFQNNIQQINQMMADSADNIVIAPSSNEGFMLMLFSTLDLVYTKYSIRVFGLPVCARFKNIEPELFHNLRFHYYTSFFMDYQSPQVQNFIRLFRKTYHYEPQDFTKEGFNFASLGYDVGMYFLNALGTKGKNFNGCLKNYHPRLIYSVFDFHKACPGCGYINKGIEIIQYTNDYYVRRAD